MGALDKLIEAVEAGTVYATMGHTMMCQKAFPPRWEGDHAKDSRAQLVVNAWNKNSLDAALALHEALLPGWVSTIQAGGSGAGVTVCHCTLQDWHEGTELEAFNQPTAARAWLLAILRAYRAQHEGQS